jgi:phosphomannomutase
VNLRETLSYEPVELAFGTSGLRGLIADMTDLECYINTAGFMRFLANKQEVNPGQVIYIAGDLRDSTPRILQAVARALLEDGYKIEHAGFVPTPALAYYALQKQAPCIMVTGSHIPADRNGIKFYKPQGEVLKEDEADIKHAVAIVRQSMYQSDAGTSLFTSDGSLKQQTALPESNSEAIEAYTHRFINVFADTPFAGCEIVFYQHSAVGRELLPNLLEQMGAIVHREGWSDTFIPIDSENVTAVDRRYFQELAAKYPQAFAIVSTDGDSDRPFVIDETGEFHRGDVLGAVTAEWLQADAVAYPVSSSDAVDTAMQTAGIAVQHTKIGSPYVVSAMQHVQDAGASRVVGWEVNGGFMLQTDVSVAQGTLQPLPTRDAFLPIVVSLLSAVQKGISVSELFGRLPQRFTDAGLIDNFPVDVSKRILQSFSQDTPEARQELQKYFGFEYGFTDIRSINTVDGIRITFENGDIAHLRPSGNAPQMRTYSVADSDKRAQEIVALAIAEPSGILRRIEQSIA